MTSDFDTTAVGMLDADGTPITEAWIDSGTTRPGITATIGGDVVMPTWPLASRELDLIDRLGADVLTRISVPDARVIDQAHLQSTGAEDTGFRSNPHDVLALGDGRALVTRHNPNLNADAGPLDRGDDLGVLDLASGTLTSVISLASLDAVDGSFYARPSKLARVGSRVVVGLARLSAFFDAAGPGALGVVDPTSESVAELELPRLVNCGTVAPVPDDSSRALVLCGGDPFARTAAEQRARSGIALVSVDMAGVAHVERSWHASEHPELPPPYWAIVSLGGDRLVYTSLGIRDAGTGDALVALDLVTGEGRVLDAVSGEFVLGQGAYDATAALLLWPDALAGIRRYHVGGGLDVVPMDVVDPSPCRHLPAREIRALLAE